MNKMKKTITNILIMLLLVGCSNRPATHTENELTISRSSLTLIPPSPITRQVLLDIRGAVWNESDRNEKYEVSVYLDNVNEASLIHRESFDIPSRKNAGFKCNLDVKKYMGKHNVIMVTTCGKTVKTNVEALEIIDSDIRSTMQIEGAWFEFYHWCEQEGRLWNKDIIKLTDHQWKELVKGMHDIDMNIMVIQELFRSQAYVDQHKMDSTGYQGIAYYPSDLYPHKPTDTLLLQVNHGKSSPNYPEYTHLNAKDVVNAVLEEADQLNMKIFLGVGSYAWFDFSPGALQWSKEVAKELWEKYGHHKSFYGWYISGEIAGNLGRTTAHREQIVRFFKEFSKYAKTLAPDKPVMLATNCHSIKDSEGYYPALLENLDIICPFGFHRMPKNDYTGKEAAEILQRYCNEAGSHLWMDVEMFLFREDGALYPRPIKEILNDLNMFDNFEKICCYSYTGLMNAGWQSICPGGEATIELYNDYMRYLVARRTVSR